MIRAKPRDVPDLHGFEGIRGGRWMNAMNTWGKRGDTTHTRTQFEFSLVGSKHQLDRGCEKRPSGRSPAKRSTNQSSGDLEGRKDQTNGRSRQRDLHELI